jgi:hypothetical protein
MARVVVLRSAGSRSPFEFPALERSASDIVVIAYPSKRRAPSIEEIVGRNLQETVEERHYQEAGEVATLIRYPRCRIRVENLQRASTRHVVIGSKPP